MLCWSNIMSQLPPGSIYASIDWDFFRIKDCSTDDLRVGLPLSSLRAVASENMCVHIIHSRCMYLFLYPHLNYKLNKDW